MEEMAVAGGSPCSCSELGSPLSPAGLDRRRTWCDGETLLSPEAGGARRALRDWVTLSPALQEEEEGESPPRRSPPRTRRAPSLPEGDCCQKCKKRVQFADSLGLSLASVKHFSAAEDPQVPPAVLSRLQEDAGEPPPPPAALPFQLRPDFPEPTGGAAMAERLRRERVALERAYGAGQFEARVWALVRAPGAATVRYTFNDWLSFVDAQSNGPAEPLEGGGFRLRFTLSAPPCLEPGARLQFALCHREESGGECWDNNQGHNYTLRYQEAAGSSLEELD